MNQQQIDSLPVQQTSTIDEQDIFDNIDSHLHGPMTDFIKRYFANFNYIYDNGMLEISQAGKIACRCDIPIYTPSSDKFIEWLSRCIASSIDGTRGSWQISSEHTGLDQERNDHSTCFVLNMPSSQTSPMHTKRGQSQVIGQCYLHDCTSYQDGLVRLCRSAYSIFTHQPTRLFLHAFYIRGSLAELWVFDRSGLYCSNIIDLRKDFVQFLFIVLSYQLMTDQELGNLNIIEEDDGGNFVTLDNHAGPSLGKLYLEEQPIAAREGLVGNGTTCYRARSPTASRWDHVLKFKWRWARDRPEDELLRLATKQSAWGAVSLDHYEELESTANLRRGLRWGKHRKFSVPKGPKSHDTAQQQRQDITGDTDGLIDYTEETDESFRNLVLTVVVTSPVGRPLHSFESVLELLQVFRDAIRCHKSLYYDAKILHQDISHGNIIILDDQDEGKPKGILIDLDSAIEVTNGPSLEHGITGTRPFMAIGVLKKEPHTYRHDLESFLYVFLWTIITNHKESPPETSKLRAWSQGDWNELTLCKSFDMDKDNFASLLGEFTSDFHSLRPLAEKLRQKLFPLRDGVIWTGTDDASEVVHLLYDDLISEFKHAIVLEGGQ